MNAHAEDYQTKSTTALDESTPMDSAHEHADDTALTSKEDKPGVSDEEWIKMKSMVTDQIDKITASLDDLRSTGALESISRHISHGDLHPTRRLLAWYQIMIEIEFINRPEVTKKIEFIYRSHTRSSSQPAPSFVLDVSRCIIRGCVHQMNVSFNLCHLSHSYQDDNNRSSRQRVAASIWQAVGHTSRYRTASQKQTSAISS